MLSGIFLDVHLNLKHVLSVYFLIKTRNKIQEEFKRLIPLYNEICNNETEDVNELEDTEHLHDHIISTIHHLAETAPKVLKKIKHFY